MLSVSCKELGVISDTFSQLYVSFLFKKTQNATSLFKNTLKRFRSEKNYFVGYPKGFLCNFSKCIFLGAKKLLTSKSCMWNWTFWLERWIFENILAYFKLQEFFIPGKPRRRTQQLIHNHGRNSKSLIFLDNFKFFSVSVF